MKSQTESNVADILTACLFVRPSDCLSVHQFNITDTIESAAGAE